MTGLDPSKKMRDVRTIHFHPLSRREPRHVSENEGFRVDLVCGKSMVPRSQGILDWKGYSFVAGGSPDRRQIAQWAGTRTTYPGGTGFETGVRDQYLPKTRECVSPCPQRLFLPPKTRPRVFHLKTVFLWGNLRECMSPFPQGLFMPPKTRPRVFYKAKNLPFEWKT